MMTTPATSHPPHYTQLNGYKNYPILTLVRIALAVLGWMALGFGIIGMISSIGSLIMGLREITTIPAMLRQRPAETLSLFWLFGISLIGAFTGFGMISWSELLKLMMDLQENADRQSILLGMIYNQNEKERHEQAN